MIRVQAVTPTGAARLWLTVALFVVCLGLAFGFTIAYVATVDRRSEARSIDRERDICGIIVLLDDRNQKLPPAADPDTAAFRTELHRYRERLGC